MKLHRKQAILSLALLIVPLVVYVFFRTCSHQVFKPVAYAYELGANGDTTYYKVSDFELTDENGQKLTAADLQGQLTLLSFFTPNLSDSASALIEKVAAGNLKKDFYENAEKIPFIKIWYISTHPVSTTTLKQVREQQGLNSDKWKFATASKQTVWNIAKDQTHLPEFLSRDTSAAPFPVAHAVLIDKRGYVRGYMDKYDKTLRNHYQTTQTGIRGMTTLKEDLRALLMTEYKAELSAMGTKK